MIANGQFYVWLNIFLKRSQERKMWEFWLYRVFDMSWDEFLNQHLGKDDKEAIFSEEEIKTTVNNSFELLSNFHIEIERKEDSQ